MPWIPAVFPLHHPPGDCRAVVLRWVQREGNMRLGALRGYAQFFFWRRNPTKTLGFLLPWFSPWFFVGFLLSPPPCAQSFLRNPRFLVLADFFPWILKTKQLLGFLGVVYKLK